MLLTLFELNLFDVCYFLFYLFSFFFGCRSITNIGRESGVRRSKEGGGKEAGGGGGERGWRRDEEGRGRSSVASIVEVVIEVHLNTGKFNESTI